MRGNFLYLQSGRKTRGSEPREDLEDVKEVKGRENKWEKNATCKERPPIFQMLGMAETL